MEELGWNNKVKYWLKSGVWDKRVGYRWKSWFWITDLKRYTRVKFGWNS